MVGIEPTLSAATPPVFAPAAAAAPPPTRDEAVYRQLLVNEVVGAAAAPSPPSTFAPSTPPRRRRSSSATSPHESSLISSSVHRSGSTHARSGSAGQLLSSPQKMLSYSGSSSGTSSGGFAIPAGAMTPSDGLFSLTPLSGESVRLLTAPAAVKRPIATSPFKVLEAPGLADDFYVNPLSWGEANVIAVSLRQGVYLWNAATTAVSRLCSADGDDSDVVTAVAWRNAHPEQLTIAAKSGVVRVFDVSTGAVVTELRRHVRRVGVVAWSSTGRLLATGSKDQTIALTDTRASGGFSSAPCIAREHHQEVCGLRWDLESNWLASGGNDNKLVVWDVRAMQRPLIVWDQHKAAVKALAWSPRTRGALVSGGGSADRRLRFWDVRTLRADGDVDTGSQVCNVHWSRVADELVTSHGFSQHQILIWDAAARVPIATLRGHTSRVLHLASSPDGRTIVTGAGDQTLRFWAIFPPPSSPAAAAAVPLPRGCYLSDCCSIDLR